MNNQEASGLGRTVERTDRFVERAVEFISGEAKVAVAERGAFRLSLCGGSTPAGVYRSLAKVADFPWEQTVITFGDERCYPPDHERSNYRMAKEAFLDEVKLPEQQVIRMQGELGAERAAQVCEEDLRSRAVDSGEAVFAHDLVLLGMGDDGHTASLFPETPALAETERWVVGNYVPKFDEHRITFTYPLINAARRVCFLVNGEAKRPIYEAIFAGEGSHYPAASIVPASGQQTWIIGN
jgi:6-phosphogluconolactonase